MSRVLKAPASAVVALVAACATSSPAGFDTDSGLPEQDAAAPDVIADVVQQDTPGPSSCTDGIKNGTETDVDCGGSCPKCKDGQGCLVATDCAAGTCAAGKCGPRAWTVESTGKDLAIPATQTWTNTVGLTLSPTLYTPSLMLLQWTGTSRFAGGGNGLCYMGQRFVVDGTPTGDATWGDAIMVQRGSTRWHEPFTDQIVMPLTAGAHTLSVQMTNGTGTAVCNLDGDGGAAYERSRLAASAYDASTAWYADSNAETGALAGGSPWTAIPGVTVSFNLAAAAHVQSSLSGSEDAAGTGAAHCAYRFVIDGTPLGDPTHGQAIAVADVGGGWWAPVSLKYGQDMGMGAHTILAQVSNSSAQGGTCNAGQGNNAYSRFHLFVSASPTGGANASSESAGGSDVLGSNSAWTGVGGLSATFNVAADRHVQLELAATQRTVSGSGHCSYRFVVDGSPLGDVNYGQGIDVGDGATTWWTDAPLLWGQTFAAGSHTVSVDLRNSSNTGDCGVNGDGAPYGRARLLVRAP